MAEDCVERGLGYLSRKMDEGVFDGIEAIRAYRTLRMLDRKACKDDVLKRLSMEEADDLPGAVAKALLDEKSEISPGSFSLMNDDGGCAVEAGGRSEIGATLFCLGTFYEFEWTLPKDERGLKFILKNLGLEVEHVENSRIKQMYRQLLELGIIECLTRFYWGSAGSEAEDEDRVNRFMALLEGGRQKLLDDSQEGSWLYEASLLVRMFSMIGRPSDVSDMAELIERTQHDDGHWEDTYTASSCLVTCAALEALATYHAAVSEAVVVKAGFKGEAYSQCFEAAVESGNESMVISWMLLDASGKYVMKGEQIKNHTSFGLNLSMSMPGSYRVDIRVFLPQTKALIGRKVEDIEIMPWRIMEGLKRPKTKLPGNTFKGKDITLAPFVGIDYFGNLMLEGEIRWMVFSPSGVVIMNTKPQDVLLSEYDLSRLGYDEMILCTTNETKLQEGIVHVDEEGYHELRVVLECADGQFESSTMFYVRDTSDIQVTNELVPPLLPARKTNGKVKMTLRAQKKTADGIAEMLSGVKFRVLERKQAEGAENFEISLNGICGQDGKNLEDGWIAVRVNYGRVIDGKEFDPVFPEGSFTLHRVSNGNAKFTYRIDDAKITGTVPMQLFACVKQGDTVKEMVQLCIMELLL